MFVNKNNHQIETVTKWFAVADQLNTFHILPNWSQCTSCTVTVCICLCSSGQACSPCHVHFDPLFIGQKYVDQLCSIGLNYVSL